MTAGLTQRNHAALRVGVEKFIPYTYTDPLAIAATDLIPEVAAAYAESLRVGRCRSTPG
jgi:hypothetical protein